MAIDNTGISSLETGAPDIKYTGDEGPKDPRVMSEIDKIILQHWLQQGGTYGDVIPEEFKQQVIQMYGLDKMASVPEMADGGIARLGYENGDLVHQFNNYARDDGGNVSVPRTFQARTGSNPVNLAYITPQEEGILQTLKPGTPHRRTP